MKYDDASWHFEGHFPSDLSPDAGATHIALFVAWAVLDGLASDSQKVDGADHLAALRSCRTDPVRWFSVACDFEFTDQDLNAKGNAFSATSYGTPDAPATRAGRCLADYERCFPGMPSLYPVPPGRGSYDLLAPTLSRRSRAWGLVRRLTRAVRR